MSQGLAQAEERGLIESMLWSKVVSACQAASIPLGPHAPDFVVAAMIPPVTIGVYRINDQAPGVETNDAAQVFEDAVQEDAQQPQEPTPAPKKKPRRRKAETKDGDK